MPRLLGVDIPSDKPTLYSLQYLYGVGPKVARELCHKAGVNPQTRQTMTIPASTSPGFSASNNLKETVRQSQSRESGGKNG